MLLDVLHLNKSFFRGRVKAVQDVSFSIGKNETVGVLGGSGSGKSTLAKLILGLLLPDQGVVRYSGKVMGAVFQEPFLSLNPQMTLFEILSEPFAIQGQTSRNYLSKKSKGLLNAVELPEAFLKRRPRELSGGECQRVAIARAISTEPELIICDEPVSSLDTLVQAQILNLLLKLQKEKGISYFFISHNRKVVYHMSDRVLVMEDGKVIE